MRNGSRKAVRLGRVPQRVAEAFKVRIEALLACKIANAPLDRETAAWLAKLPDAMHAKLAGAGLAEPRGGVSGTALGTFLDAYVARKTDIEPASLLAILQVVRKGASLLRSQPAVAYHYRRR